MALIGTRTFKGEIPRLRPHLIGDTNAQRAIDCDFANGSLKPLKGGFLLSNMANNPVRGIYTEDGVNFYTWAAETYAFQSPVIDDVNLRVYYLTPSQGEFRVTTKLGMSPFGPSPAGGNTFLAGVPRPTVAPQLSVVDNRSIPGIPVMPDYPLYSLVIEAWWEDATGRQYARSNFSWVQIVELEEYTITKPIKPIKPSAGNTDVPDSYDPETLRLAIRLKLTNTESDTEILAVLARGSTPGRSSALPGSLEVSVDEEDANTARIRLKWGISETRAYTYTYKNTWDEESAPAPADTISLTYIQSVRVQATAGVFTNYRPFSKYQIYRTFGASGSYLPIKMISPGPVFIDGYAKPDPDGEALQSTNWTPPPKGLQGIDLTANGWFVAFKGNTLYMSEPFRPHAWPYNMTFPKNIRGVRVGQQSIVVTTAEGVHVVAGAHPSAAQSIRLSTPQAGIAARSMTNVDDAVAYASRDGFVMVSGTSASTEMSQQLFDRETWKRYTGTQLSDASMRFAYHDGALVASTPTNITASGEIQGFLLRMDETAGSFTRTSARYDSTFYLPVADSLYYSSGAAVYQFRGGDPGTFDWWSRDFIFPMQETFGAGYIRCTGAANLEVYAEGVLVATKTGLTTGHFRLSDRLPRKLRWSFRLTGSGEVFEIFLARSMMELQNG